uniref:TSA: Wollemia nobilis Ref_Wollemi_Transcript_11181_4406 transcribed RNA sequence n=1 Tax=Wollemia nobilis TaxID=56998 RepID=A0A0C9S8H8_9CONI
MVSPVPPGERPGYPGTGNSTGYPTQRPLLPGTLDSAGGLAGNMQNLHISRPPPPPWAAQGPRPGIGMQNSGPPARGPPGSRPMGGPFSSPVPLPQGAPQSSVPPSAVMASGPPSVRPVGPPFSAPQPVSAPNSNVGRTVSAPFPQRPNAPPSRPPASMPPPALGVLQDGSGSQFPPGMNVNFSPEVNNGPSPFAPGASMSRPPANAMHPQFGPPTSQIRSSAPFATSAPGAVSSAQRLASAAPPPPFTAPSSATPSTYPVTGLGPSSAPSPPFPVASQSRAPSSASLYGTQPWRPPSQQPTYPDNNYANVPPPPPAAGIQAPGMYGMPPPPRQLSQTVPPVPPAMGHPPGTGILGMGQPGSPAAGAQGSGTSRIDPNQIPRPGSNSTPLVFETRTNNQANLPPSATSDFIVRDTGNCSPRYMRCTLNQIPCSGDLLNTSGMPLALMVQPFALPHPSEEPIQVVDFGDSGPVRCSRCKGYINPFMRFIDQGRRFICNLCGFSNETPREYHCNLGPDGRRRDADERPELCRGTVEFVATKEYMVRDPMPAVFFFLIDVSMNAIQTGATAAACSAIQRAVADLPEGPRTKVGVATFDSTIHFYNLNRAFQQPSMLVVPDVQDVYNPLQTELIVTISECRQRVEQLLESIPTMFENNKIPESAFGAAIKGVFLAMKSTGGKLLVFQSVLPSVGIGALSAREAEGRANTSAGEKEAHKLLQPADKTLKTMAMEFAEMQVCVDLFLTTQTYVDIASTSVVPRTTGGQVYYYYPFSAVADSAKLYNDLRWNITRPQGLEAVMRVRCSQGLQVQDYSGNFCKRIPTDVDLAGVDCDKTIMVTFKHDDKFQEGSECAFQCAVLYTTVYGQRRIRVTTLSLPCTSVLSNLFRGADLDAQFTYFLKKAANEIATTPLLQVREQMTGLCVSILHTYRKFCATASSSGQLILPEALKLLPLYTLALTKSIGLRTDVRIDDRSYWLSRVASISASLAIPLVYPRMFAIHNLPSKDTGNSILPPALPLSSEHIDNDAILLLENGEDALIYAGKMASPDMLRQLFGVQSIDEIPSHFLLQEYDNDHSRKLNEVVNEIRRQRCSYLRLRVCKRADPAEFLFFSVMIEDKNSLGLSYVEFLVHIHRQIQNKMA